MSTEDENGKHALDVVVGGVLFNASNYPEKATPHILGQDIAPLREKVVAAVLGALTARDAEKKAEAIEEAIQAVLAAVPTLNEIGYEKEFFADAIRELYTTPKEEE